MEVKKIKLIPKKIDKKAFVHTPEYLPKLHCLCVVAGSRGSGKTYSTTNLIRFYKKEGLCDKCIIISPTGISNKVFYEDLINDEQDIISDVQNSTIGRVIEIIEQEAQDYESYKHIKDLFAAWKKFERKKIDIDDIDPEMLLEFEKYQIWDMEEPPKWKYKDDTRPPLIHVMLDDCMGTNLMKSSGPLINFAIKHRHIAGIGCSLYILTQSYIAVSSTPRSIRENATVVILFRVRDEKLKEQLAQEATPAQYSPEQFLEAFEYATGDDIHNFLMLDYSAKKGHILRKNFDTLIDFDSK